MSFLPKGELEDIIAYPNNDDSNTPHVRVVPSGKANEIIKSQRDEAKKKKEQQNNPEQAQASPEPQPPAANNSFFPGMAWLAILIGNMSASIRPLSTACNDVATV